MNVEQSNLQGRVPSPQAHSLEGPSTPNIPAAITCQKKHTKCVFINFNQTEFVFS